MTHLKLLQFISPLCHKSSPLLRQLPAIPQGEYRLCSSIHNLFQGLPASDSRSNAAATVSGDVALGAKTGNPPLSQWRPQRITPCEDLIQKYSGSCAGHDASAQPRSPSHWRQEAKQHFHYHSAFCQDHLALNRRLLYSKTAPSLELLPGSSSSCALQTSSQAALSLAAEHAAIDGQDAPKLPTGADPAWLGRAPAARRGIEREREGVYPFSAKAFYVGEFLDAKEARLILAVASTFALLQRS